MARMRLRPKTSLLALLGLASSATGSAAPAIPVEVLSQLQASCSALRTLQLSSGSLPTAESAAPSVSSGHAVFRALFQQLSAEHGDELGSSRADSEASQALSHACGHLLRFGAPEGSPSPAEAVDEVAERRAADLDWSILLSPIVLSPSSRRLEGEPWYMDHSTFYISTMLVGLCVIVIIIFFQESVILTSSLVWSPHKIEKTAEMLSRTVKKKVTGPHHDMPMQVVRQDSIPEERRPNEGIENGALHIGQKHRETFLAGLKLKVRTRFDSRQVSQEAAVVQAEVDKDIVGFAMRSFVGLEAKEVCSVTVERSGQLIGSAAVKVRAIQAMDPGSFCAKPNVDFIPMDAEITFDEGEQFKSFDITLLQTNTTWSPTRWFRVELYEVVSGDVILGGPTISAAGNTMMARCFILQDDIFPGQLPEKLLNSDMWMLWYYFKERIAARGSKFWYTLFGMLYEPIHSSVVTPLVQAFLLDWAANPDESGSFTHIVLLAGIQLVSYTLLRQGDVWQTKNRGRTGGCRQLHRTQLLSKLLMMEHAEQYEHPGEAWFYSGLMNVDVMVKDGYWQIFIVAQSVFGIVLSIAVLVAMAAYKARRDGGDFEIANLMPAIALLLLTPVAFSIISRRRKMVAHLLDKRMDGECEWVETFAWLADNGSTLFFEGPRELAQIEKHFDSKSKAFVKDHQKARDYSNDSRWVTRWIGATAYCLILIWASTRLFQARMGEIASFEAGDCILLIQLFDRFTRYMGKLSNSFVDMQRGAVSLRKVATLLHLPEQKSLLDIATGDIKVPLDQGVKPGVILVGGVSFDVPDRRTGLGPMTKLVQTSPFEIPLGKVVIIRGGTESQRFTFLALIARLIKPQQGSIIMPSNVWSILVPSTPTTRPFGTVKDDFMITGISEKAARNLADLLDLEPDVPHVRLPVGKANLLALARSLLRDPTVLLAVRPLRNTPFEFREHIANLMLTWQSSGGSHTLTHYLENPQSSGLVASEAAEENAQEAIRIHRQPRTLIIADDDFPNISPESVHVINISEHFDMAANRL